MQMNTTYSTGTFLFPPETIKILPHAPALVVGRPGPFAVSVLHGPPFGLLLAYTVVVVTYPPGTTMPPVTYVVITTVTGYTVGLVVRLAPVYVVVVVVVNAGIAVQVWPLGQHAIVPLATAQYAPATQQLPRSASAYVSSDRLTSSAAGSHHIAEGDPPGIALGRHCSRPSRKRRLENCQTRDFDL